MESKTMTVKEFAEAMDVTYTTVIRWLKVGLVPGAYTEEVFPGMDVWRIPHEAISMQRPKAGAPRRKTKKATKKGKAA
jgi:hypothetical protein